LENSRKKLASKNCDLICANCLTTEGAGFGTDTNVLTLITKDYCVLLPKISKEEAAHEILTKILKEINKKNAVQE
ncbi:MAG: phosphopantothenoylcysteine decarboxylase, partial [Oscillospiraceae bacterium]|nr:phosphopantothenoylcysteine decarboxylase [Oscillospiraceae bacterium]